MSNFSFYVDKAIRILIFVMIIIVPVVGVKVFNDSCTMKEINISIQETQESIQKVKEFIDKKTVKPTYIVVDFYSVNINNLIKAAKSYPKKMEEIYIEITKFTGSRMVTEAIVDNCLIQDVPIALAMGIAWTESRFFPRAVNGIHNANGTSDWGLFQVNDINLPDGWRMEDKLDINKNSLVAIRHIKELVKYILFIFEIA